MLKKLLTFAAALEIGTGVALLIEPRMVFALLVGNEPVQAMPLGRLTGIAILAFGVACWPRGVSAAVDSSGWRAMLLYSALMAVYLAYLFIVGHLGGVLLWPAVVLHAVIAVLLVWARRAEQRGRARPPEK